MTTTQTNARHRKPPQQRPAETVASAGGHTNSGTFTMNSRGFGFVTVDSVNDPAVSCFVPPPLVGDTLDGDRVEVTYRTDPDGRLTATDLLIVERIRTRVFGRAIPRGDAWTVQLDPHVGRGTRPLDPAGLHVKTGSVVEADIETPGKTIAVRAWNAATPEALRHMIAARHRITVPFPSAALAQAATVRGDKAIQRRDLRDFHTFTIDDDKSRDLDDALTVFPPDRLGAVRVWVHISDVTAHIPAGSPLDIEARRAATSVYLPGGVRPMLPKTLSENALSLIPAVDRDALTVQFTVQRDGKVTGGKVFASRIRSDLRINYEQATAVIEGRHSDLPEITRTTLRHARRASDHLASARAGRGQYTAGPPATCNITIDGGRIVMTDTRPEETAAGRDLIEHLMVAANETVASWLASRARPAVFRTHPGPKSGLVEAVTDAARQHGASVSLPDTVTAADLAAVQRDAEKAGPAVARAVTDALMHHMARASYAPVLGAHFGLGSDGYLHFTSPIRRYADMAVHRAVHAELTQAERLGAEDDLGALCAHLNEATASAARAESQLTSALWLSQLRVGRRLTGWVTDRSSRVVTVTVAGTLARAVIPAGGHGWSAGPDGAPRWKSGRPMLAGDLLDVRVERADPFTGELVVSAVAPATQVFGEQLIEAA